VHILCSITFSRKSCRLWDNVEKHGGSRRTANGVTTWSIWVVCCISKATCTHSHIHSHASCHKHARARTHKYVILIAFPRQQWFANAPIYHVMRILPYLLYHVMRILPYLLYFNSQRKFDLRLKYLFKTVLQNGVHMWRELDVLDFRDRSRTVKLLSRVKIGDQIINFCSCKPFVSGGCVCKERHPQVSHVWKTRWKYNSI
jgi:hypothetical protein